MDASKPAGKPDMTILIVDDHESNILTIKGLLKDFGYRLLSSSTGEDALRIADEQQPDLILLDVKMPGMDGFEVCRKLKSSRETFQIPVIFLTILDQTSDIVKGLELGAADYIPKPFKAPELLARVRVHLQLKQANDELARKNWILEEHNESLQHLNATKDKLLSIISHDLRAPMGTLKEILDFIMENYDDLDHQKLHESLVSIRDSIESSYTLVENLLLWARNQRGDIRYEPGIHDIKIIADESIRLMSASAQSKSIRLSSNAETNTKAFFDPDMISVVVRNLTNNAIKFTREYGDIRISIGDYREDPENTLMVEVSNTGVGMNPTDLSALFMNGSRISTSGTGLEKGSGLGLKLCREFVERNGGKIWAESLPGKGSAFRFTLAKKEA